MSSAKSFHETFYGTPTEEESRGRRGKKRHKAAKEEPQNEVVVIGVHYRSFDDDSMAAFVNSATALVPWNGDSKLLIDRYDVRHLLQDLTGIRRRRARPPSPDATKEELDFERYRDVEGLENPSPPDDILKNEDASADGYQRVGFDYRTGGDQATPKERVEDAFFSPPFFVPEHLRSIIPTSTKVHQIMAGTAKYVIEHGGQAEIVLRVKQANNPTFGFLMPDHYDHEYFRFLVAHPENVGIGPIVQEAPPEPEVAAPTSSEEAEGGLSLLGTAYGDADEDEEEEKVGEAFKDEAGNTQEVVEDDLKIKQRIESNSDHGTSSKRSSTVNLATSDMAENATKDTGDSLEVSLGSELPISSAKPGDVSIDGMVDSSGSQEPVPPGMEASSSGSGEMDAREGHGHSGDVDHQVPPYKEPPIQLRLIINKMVEFIARNGNEFEAIVKERDKTDHRFPFFLPWNEYHPYYVKELESARQVQLSAEADCPGSPSSREPPNAMQGQVAEKDEEPESFLNGLPFGDAARPVESSGGDAEGGTSNIPQPEEGKSHNEGGMGFDAVLAAVRVATRGRPQAVEGNQESDSRPELGSDEAVLAAIRAATGRTKLDSSVSAGKREISLIGGSNGPVIEAKGPPQTSTASRGTAVGDTKDPVLASTLSRAALGDAKDPAVGDTKDPILSSPLPRVASLGNTKDLILPSTLSRSSSVGDVSDSIGPSIPVPQSSAEAPNGLDENHVVVSKAASEQPDEGNDPAEPQLITPEKRRAERLKKAKLFAAMIKDKNGSLTDPAQLSGSLGISVPNLDRLNHVFVALESTTSKSGAEVRDASVDTQPNTRDATRDTQVPAVTEVDKEIVDSSAKERNHKAKSKEQEQRKRKHHKRKKDIVEKGKGSPDARESKKDKHQEDKRSREPEGRAKDSKRGLSVGKFRSHEGLQDLEYRTVEYEDAWKDRSHYIHDSDGRRKERKYGYEAEQKYTRDRHGHDSDRTRMESRHGYDSEEERRRDRRKNDTDRKRKDRSYRHDSEEKGYEYDSDERRKERNRSHGKRKKHLDRTEEGDDEDGRRHEQRKEKSRHRGDDLASAAEHTHAERQSTLHRDSKDDRKRIVSPVRQDAPLPTSLTRVAGEKSTLTSADVPDDIRAKVRAMLAMM